MTSSPSSSSIPLVPASASKVSGFLSAFSPPVVSDDTVVVHVEFSEASQTFSLSDEQLGNFVGLSSLGLSSLAESPSSSVTDVTAEQVVDHMVSVDHMDDVEVALVSLAGPLDDTPDAPYLVPTGLVSKVSMFSGDVGVSFESEPFTDAVPGSADVEAADVELPWLLTVTFHKSLSQLLVPAATFVGASTGLPFEQVFDQAADNFGFLSVLGVLDFVSLSGLVLRDAQVSFSLVKLS